MEFSFKPDLPIICITCYGRSGTVLLQSLFENHPQVMSAPAHSFVVPLAQMNLIRFMDSHLPNLSVEQIVGNTVSLYPYLFKETDQTPALKAAAELSDIGVPVKDFSGLLLEILSSPQVEPNNPAHYFRAVHYAYHLCLGRSAAQLKAIIWQYHSPIEEEVVRLWLMKHLRNVRFLVSVRRPEVTVSAHFEAKNVGESNDSALKDVPQVLMLALLGSSMHHNLIDHAVAIRFEDMHAQTKRLTEALAKWVGISWHQNMMSPTVDGQEMLFPKDGKIVRGFNPDIEKKQQAKHFSKFDKLIYAAFNKAAYEKWGYDLPPFPSWGYAFLRTIAIMIPLRMEVSILRESLRSGSNPFIAFKQAFERRRNTHGVLREMWKLGTETTKFRLLRLLDI